MDYDIELLKSLYWIHSPSGYEEGIQGFIRQYLYTKGIKFETDSDNQIYSLDNKDKPLLVAHSDQVRFKPLSTLTETNKRIYGNSNLGADDKNGIWILLNLLVEYPDLNFIFSTEEEQGGNIDTLLHIEQESLLDIPYCLVFDRKGGSDIIGYRNQYCTFDFENDVLEIAESYGFESSSGIWSDCDQIEYYLNCINISCGYHKAHTDKEYTVKKELINSLELGKAIIDNITDYYDVDFYSYQNSNNSYIDDTENWNTSKYNNYGKGFGKGDTVLVDGDECCPDCYNDLEEIVIGKPEYGFYCIYCPYETAGYIDVIGK